MTFFLNIINDIRHPEERPEGASRRTRNADAAACSDLITPAVAGVPIFAEIVVGRR